MQLDFFNAWPPPAWTSNIIIVPGLIILVVIFIRLQIVFGKTGFNEIKGQLAFSGLKLKSYYAALVERDTLDAYRKAQYLDFIYIVIYSFTFFISALGLARVLSDRGQRLGFLIAVLFPIAGCMDAMEDFLSLHMISKPAAFPDRLAIVYSSVATIKWILLIPSVLCLGTAFLIYLF